MNPNSLLVQWAEGFTTVTDSAAVTAAGGLVRRQFFSATDYTTKEGAEAAATKKLAELQGGEPIVAEPVVDVGDASAPYVGWGVGDSIAVTQFDGSGTDTVEVLGLTVTEDDDGNVSVVPELQSPVLARAEQNALALRRSAPGIRSNTVSIARDQKSDTRQGKLQLEELYWGFDGQLHDISPEYRFRRRSRATFWDLTLNVAGSTSTQLQLLKNGTPVTGMTQFGATTSYATFAAGVRHVALLIENEVFTEMDVVRFDVTTAGTGAETLSCQLLGAASEVGL